MSKEVASYQGPERRRFTRVAFPYPIYYQECGVDREHLKKKGEMISVEAKDISMGGMMVLLPRKVKPGVFLKLKFMVPLMDKYESRILSCIAEVRWVQYRKEGSSEIYPTGVEFEELGRMDKLTLDTFIKESLEGESSPRIQ